MDEQIRSTINTIEDRLEQLNEKVTHEGEDWYESLIGRCKHINEKIAANDEDINYVNCINDMQIDLDMLFDKVSRSGEDQIHTIETLLDVLRSQLAQPKLTKSQQFFLRLKKFFD